ncbi:diguanylate cyclase (GGDEF) domain-containing protein [Salinihabitans flavidus]|uniref:Diguanylate cyclase (GGDEF) domain-containing protein n=1 Tax=Salinihabitans flavidus TaxID=569882 RepID=A0A1H8P765_9RHOB|nr:EAL domain-containing protein [Salinihabitans flavidus]SEO37373.1 diguanylate cyclase (GGDEF) domain-containing protein [Salinihabitans flavidus]
MELNRQKSLSKQIVASLVVLLGTGLLTLVFVGYNAIRIADDASSARQERFAARSLAEEIADLPNDQRSVTIWDDSVVWTRARDADWMDGNLGAWVQGYFGHDETYILDPEGVPYFASIQTERVSFDRYEDRADRIAPLVAQLRAAMAEASLGIDNPYEELADVSVVAALRFDDVAAIVSVVPIVSDTGDIVQSAGTESLHVAVQYIDADLAGRIGTPNELRDVAFGPAPPEGSFTGVPVTDADDTAITWLTWQPERPGTAIFMRMLPVLLFSVLAGVGLLWWMVHRLLRLSGQLHVSEAQARFLANHDALTGLPNRKLFQDRLTQAMHATARSGQPVALIAIDLDRFKLINDSLGHPAGDELIRQVGSRLVELVRASDTVARFGGDEFMILMRDVAGDDDLRRFCARIVEQLSRPYDLLGNTGSIGASVGAVRAGSLDSKRDDLMRRADIALYRAKTEGRGRYVLFESKMGKVEHERNQIENDLRAALDTGTGLSLVYQSICDEKGRVTGAEALCRWDHPEHGALSPEIFIRVAEERGLIDRLGQWVLETACRFAVGTNLGKIAVNVSPMQLRHPGFVPMVLETLRTTGLAPTRLELELTERVLLDKTVGIREKIGQLRAAGITIALDDFATGDSSLQYLRDYRVDSIKIDRSFVARLGQDEESDHLVQAIFGLARAMGVAVTVEGVETEMQHDRLAAMGCRTFQGYLLHRPMDSEQFASTMSEGHIAIS